MPLGGQDIASPLPPGRFFTEVLGQGTPVKAANSSVPENQIQSIFLSPLTPTE